MSDYPSITPGTSATAIERALSSVAKDMAMTPGERDLLQKHMQAGAQVLRLLDPHRDPVRELILSRRRQAE